PRSRPRAILLQSSPKCVLRATTIPDACECLCKWQAETVAHFPQLFRRQVSGRKAERHRAPTGTKSTRLSVSYLTANRLHNLRRLSRPVARHAAPVAGWVLGRTTPGGCVRRTAPNKSAS